jgi:iron complex transport system substrate-binding protein
MKKALVQSVVLFLIISMLAACSPQATQAPTVAPVSTEAAAVEALPTEVVATEPAQTEVAADPVDENETVIFTDSVGREVEVPANITRIAVSGPLAQIAVFALAPDKMVGIATEWSEEAEQYLPTEYYNLPLLGQLYGGKGELNLETLLAVDAQVVIDVGEPKDSIVEDMDSLQEQTGIPFVHITAYTDSMGEAYRMLGELLNMEDEAEELATYCDDVYAKTIAIMDQVGESGKANILYLLGDSGLNVIASGSYHAEVINMLANNLAVVDSPSSKGTGNETDMEQILLWNPDVIIFAPDSIYDTVATDPAWQDLTAIKNGTYYEVPSGPYNWLGFPPSVQRYLGMMWMTQLLYPDVAQYDLYSEVAHYYELFYHSELSVDQYNELVANSIGKVEAAK